MAQYTESANK